MRIMVHPLHLFTLFGHQTEKIQWAFKQFLKETSESIVLFLPLNVFDVENMTTLNRDMYECYRQYFKIAAPLHLDYPTCDRWKYPFEMDEFLLELPIGEEIVFCGGYVENCLPRAVGAFKRDYGSFCESRNITIRVDETMSYCASNTFMGMPLFLADRRGDSEKHSRTEFEWWHKTSQY